MIGSELLLDAFERRLLLPPLSSRLNLVDLAQAIGKLADLANLELSPAASDIVTNIGESDHLILILIDGVGMNMVEMLPEDAFLRRHLQDEMLTVFPSTTAVALTSLTTAQWPASHGITGWWTHLPQLGGVVNTLQYTARSDNKNLLERDIDIERSFPVPSIWADIPRDVMLVVPDRISGSVYSRYFSGGRRTEGYDSPANGIDKVIQRITEATDKTFTYLYLPQVDSLAHLHGITRPEVLRSLSHINDELERMHSTVGSKARMVLTADHGFLDAAPANRHTLRPNRQLQPLMRFPPSGDARVIYMHTWDWARERARRYIEPLFRDKFVVIDTEDAMAFGLFGPDIPESDEVEERFGNLMIISMGDDMLEYNFRRGAGRMLQLNAHHSGLTPTEMRIPLIIA